MTPQRKEALALLAAIASIVAAAWYLGGLSTHAQGDKPTIVAGANGIGLSVDTIGIQQGNDVTSSLSYHPTGLRIAGANIAPLWVTASGEYTHIAGTTATAIRNTEGQLDSIIVNTAAAGTITVFDLASASCTGTPSTNVVAIITEAATPTTDEIVFHAHLHNGICVKASAAMDLTVTNQ